MDKPSPVKSRPHSAASTPKIPVRSSLIEKLEKTRKHSKQHEHEHAKDHEHDHAKGHTSQENSGAPGAEYEDEYKERVHENRPNSNLATPEKSIANQSDYEERETCCTDKIRNSFVLCCGFLCFGASMAIMGPTVLELGCLIGSDVSTMSWVFFSQACSALLGAICSGFIIDR